MQNIMCNVRHAIESYQFVKLVAINCTDTDDDEEGYLSMENDAIIRKNSSSRLAST